MAQARLLRGRDPVAVTAVQFLGAALAALPFSVATEGVPAAPGRPGIVLAVVGLAAGGTLLPFTLFAYGAEPGLRRGRPARSSTSSRSSARWRASSSSATRSARCRLAGGAAILAASP